MERLLSAIGHSGPMTANLQAQEETVRAALQAFIASIGAGERADLTTLRGRQFDAGLAWVHLPEGDGGLEVASSLQALVNQELRREGVVDETRPAPLFGPVVAVFGTEQQKQRYLRRMFTREDRWCQLFSEPNAGSDLFNLSTQVRRDGERWMVNGQKTWTSTAHVADFGLLIARHDPNLPKTKGLSAFILPMKQSGVDVRPIRQLTGDAEFNEVFFTDAVVPGENLLGQLGDGVRVVLTTLTNERQFVSDRSAGSLVIQQLIECWRQSGSDEPVMRDRVARLWIDAEAIRLASLRTKELLLAQKAGPEPNMTKLAYAAFLQRAYDTMMDIMGPEGALFPDRYEFKLHSDHLLDSHDPHWDFLGSRARTIAGGSSEIIKNVIGERVLGLHREPREDQDRPYRELGRGQ